ncbi:hypothetical protein [Mucilaginibacter pedocola]|uniref:Lipoprotein n=1 Tax=Mucilaginibacter pedocola TaxID=1792845 RepID=A0A1S9P8P2_9SPHI|nr:hypothetical protein [Mucilaginibacter pedocola]OOQ57315.1 hypothetical protein BC343_14470 [Mucilaginibacter pedocola]
MKAIYLPILCLLLFSCGEGKKNQPTQDTTQASLTDTVDSANAVLADTAAADAEPTDPIVFIRQIVEDINTSPTEKKHFEFMCDEQMKVDYYYSDNRIVKISVDYGTVGDVYAKEDYYYSAEGKLIFMYEFTEGGPACEGCIKKHEYRSYIQNDKVIKYLKDKVEEKCRMCAFASGSKQYKLLSAKDVESVNAILCR